MSASNGADRMGAALAEWRADPRFAEESKSPETAFKLGYLAALRDVSEASLKKHGVKFDANRNAIIESIKP
jgi:hypothetical protein